MYKTAALLSLLLTGIITQPEEVRASMTSSTEAEQPVEEPTIKLPIWNGTAELGSIRTTGDTDTSNFSGKFSILRKGEFWDSGLKLSVLTSKEDGETSKERYEGTLTLDHKFTEHHYLASSASYEFDRFSGYDYQTLISLGYGYRLTNTDEHHLDLEVGPGYRYDKLKADNEIEEETVLRLAGKFFWQLNEAVQFDQLLSVNTGSQRTIWLSETGLKSQINGSLATKINYRVDYTDVVPEDAANTNTEFEVTLAYSF